MGRFKAFNITSRKHASSFIRKVRQETNQCLVQLDHIW